MASNIFYSNKNNFLEILSSFKEGWFDKIHSLSYFDGTLTKAFVWWEKTPSLIYEMRKWWYLWENYTEEASNLFKWERERIFRWVPEKVWCSFNLR